MADKLRIIQIRSRGVTKKAIKDQSNIFYRIIGRIEADKGQLLSMDKNKVRFSVQRCIALKYPEIEERVIEFISLARSQRLPVSMRLIRERALMTAESLKINSFKASPGWLEKFLRRTSVQPSFKLHGKGNSQLSKNHLTRIEEIRQIASEYDVSNIYNMDESGLFYRMGPRRTYLSGEKSSAEVRVTEFNKHKERVTVVLYCNADGNHVLPPRYIGTAARPRCFQSSKYSV